MTISILSDTLLSMNKYKNPWPPVSFIDEKRYNIELKDGTCISNVEYWAFGGGFEPIEEAITKYKKRKELVRYILADVKSFELSE